jgi:hypothetical protein
MTIVGFPHIAQLGNVIGESVSIPWRQFVVIQNVLDAADGII